VSAFLQAANADSGKLRVLAWRYPEWWAIALSAAAWLLMLVPFASLHHHQTRGGFWEATRTETFRWMLMVIAMMLPLVIDAIRIAAARSLWPRRHRSVAGFVLGYLAVWLIAGALTSMAVTSLRTQLALDGILAAAVFVLAAGWQLTAAKQRALRSCHFTMPLAPEGWSADRDCIRYGWAIGSRCLVTCWALMIGCAVSGHGMLPMVCATCVGMAERYSMKPDHRVLAGVLAAFAAVHGGAALF